MPFAFKASDIKKLEKLFGTPAKPKGSNYRFEIAPADPAAEAGAGDLSADSASGSSGAT